MKTYEFIELGFMPNPEIDFVKSQKIVVKEIKNKQIAESLKNTLNILGLKFKKLSIYNPNTYNYSTDSIDLTIYNSINKQKLKKAILKYSEEINKELQKNKSYDGYIALSPKNINEELENLNTKKGYSVNCLVLFALINCLNPNIIQQIKDIITDSIREYESEEL